jgi:hypothetical protein
MGMGKTRVRATKEIRDKWIKEFLEKEAQGRYEPFYRTQDVTSSGVKARVPCPNSPGRVYHTLSTNETFTLMELLHDPLVVDIKEQYPVVDVRKSEAFAKELKIKHPSLVWSAVNSVITWDFLCKMKAGPKRVIIVKPSSQLEDERTKEKVELEMALAISCGYEVCIVTDKDVKTVAVKNIFRVLRGANLASELTLLYPKWKLCFFELVRKDLYVPINEHIEQASVLLGINYVDSFKLMQRGFWIRDLSSDPKVALRPEYSAYYLGMDVNA